MNLIFENPTRYLFFTGKGGVGKTTLACATAINLARREKNVLLVSTDPASNLDDVLETPLGTVPTPVAGLNHLWAMNIDPEAAAQAFRERSIGPFRDLLPADAIRQMEEQLSGACTTEIAAFDEFTELLAGAPQFARFDHIVLDTAPTGHTLRLLQLPAAWTDFLDTNTTGTTCLGPSSGLKTQHERYEKAVRALSDARLATLILVARPDVASLAEADKTSAELRAAGLASQRLILNGVFQAADPGDPVAAALEDRGRKALASMPPGLRALPTTHVPLSGHNMVGLESFNGLFEKTMGPISPISPIGPIFSSGLPSLSELIDDLAARGRGLTMVMGKGGVGKTTLACAIAVELASRGLPVHLTTTDPAAHVSAAVAGELPGLTISRIDPEAETRAYTARILGEAGRELDDQGRALLEEDLRSPCTQEIAVFHAFSRIVAEAAEKIVVLDTAPTGHTLLLLDATGAYHREIVRNRGTGGSPVNSDQGRAAHATAVTPLTRLRDPEYTRILLIALAETTPVAEAAALQGDLRRAGIEPYAWIINNSLAAAHPRDPVLVRRAGAELAQIAKVRGELAKRTYIVPFQSTAPSGLDGLRELAMGRDGRD